MKTKTHTHVRSFLRCAMLAASLVGVAPAQSDRPWSTPQAGDPEVYASFFCFHDDFMKWVEERKAAKPARGEQLTRRVAAIHKIAVPELMAVTAVAREVLRDLNKLEAERRAYDASSNAKKTAPDPRVLREFEFKRKQVALSAMLKLKRTLPPSDWAGLDSYINSQYRLGIHSIASASK